MTENVGFIGLGQLGLPMATNLVDAGYALTVYNRSADKAGPLVARGAKLAAAAIDVATPGGVVVTSLWDGPIVERMVTTEFLERMTGGLHISTTTMSPATSKQLAASHARHGVGFVEAPVFGRPEAAVARQLAIPYAGADSDKQRAKPYLAALGASSVFDLGEALGAALATKLAGNFMIFSAVRTFAEALAMAKHAGADPRLVVEMLTSTLFAAPIYKSYGQRLAEGQPSFVSKIPEKDLGLFVAAAAGSTPIADLFRTLVHPSVRAVLIAAPGDLDVVTVGARTVRPPGDGEVRIAVKAAAVNPTDLLVRERGARVPPPWTPGMDAAGTIESVGPGVDRLRAGDAVMAAVTPQRPEGGAQAELIVVPAASVVKIPDGASFAEASTLPMNGLTALLGLDALGLAPGETLVVTGGAGVLAQYAIALAKERGLRVIADASRADAALVRGSGADVVVARGERFTEEVLAHAPGGAEAVFDTALLYEAAFPVIRDGGALVVVRGWSGGVAPRGIVVHPIFVGTVLERTDWLEQLRGLASAGKLRLRVAGEYPVARIADAQRAMAGGLRGRAVLTF